MVAFGRKPVRGGFGLGMLAGALLAGGSAQIGYTELAAWAKSSLESAGQQLRFAPTTLIRAVPTLMTATPVPLPPPVDFETNASAESTITTGSIDPSERGTKRADVKGSTVGAGAFVHRIAKADRMVPAESLLQQEIAEAAEALPGSDETDAELQAALRSEPFREYDISLSLESQPRLPTEPAESHDLASEEAASSETVAGFAPPRVFFDPATVGPVLAAIEPWSAGEAPIVNVPAVNVALAAPAQPESRRPATNRADQSVTIASKGEVTGEDRRPMSPAQRLGLEGRARAKAERCLANAVYFESRGEAVRGQIAVAQVVLNRAFSGYYPHDVCGVVYQGAHRHLSCQFTFACDGIPDMVTEAEPWSRAQKVARAALDGKLWLNEVGKATHYHAYWVMPYWVRSMRKLHKIGVHSFYRPRMWGDGADAPSWGDKGSTEIALKL
jgi:spore germination cell wall hydrolase CwlJ-like protein